MHRGLYFSKEPHFCIKLLILLPKASFIALWEKLGFEQVYTPPPPRSPDLNSIENIFNLAKEYLQQEACEKEIVFERVDDFRKRIERAVHTVAREHADKAIGSLPKRCEMVKAAKGARIPY